jgi:hypothetical protein
MEVQISVKPVIIDFNSILKKYNVTEKDILTPNSRFQINIKIKNGSCQIANGFRRLLLGEIDTKVLTITKYECTEKLYVIEYMESIFNQLPIDQERDFTKFKLKVLNENDTLKTVYSNDIEFYNESTKLNDFMDKSYVICELKKGDSIIIEGVSKLNNGFIHNNGLVGSISFNTENEIDYEISCKSLYPHKPNFIINTCVSSITARCQRLIDILNLPNFMESTDIQYINHGSNLYTFIIKDETPTISELLAYYMNYIESVTKVSSSFVDLDMNIVQVIYESTNSVSDLKSALQMIISDFKKFKIK